MTSEIDALRQVFVGQPRPTAWPERRARMDAICGIDPLPEGVAYRPETIGPLAAEWSLAPGSDARRVLLFLHGGGYCSGSIASHRGLVGRVGAGAGIGTLALGYRLAPENPFPAALEDALAAWHFLRARGFAADAIAIGGDSAGGGLTLAALTRLRAAGEALPACAWLASPWVDLEMTGATMQSKDAVDPLIHDAYLRSLADGYLAGHDPRDPLASPLRADLSGLPPALIEVGSAETLLDDASRIAGRLGAAGVRVDLQIWPQMIHAWMIWAARLEAGRQAIAQAAAFLRAHLAPQP